MKQGNEHGRRLEGGMVGRSLTRALPDRAFLLKERKKLRSFFQVPRRRKKHSNEKETSE